jgi:hypothetical protein
MSKGNNRGNAKIVREADAAYQNVRRGDNFLDHICWYIQLYRASNGVNDTHKIGSLRAGGKVFEAYLTVKERDA